MEKIIYLKRMINTVPYSILIVLLQIRHPKYCEKNFTKKQRRFT